mmetsp:Transcript_32281/g.63928  ORF Transcript_32281/g.63928 Transcript_32281/m.63928 type:complete len:250 (+) Transcript_32281:123-872(+)
MGGGSSRNVTSGGASPKVSQDEITKRLDMIKKFDSKVQNDILAALDEKMKDLVSVHSGRESRDSIAVKSDLPIPKDLVKKTDKTPKRLKRKAVGFEIIVDRVLVVQTLEAEGVVLKVYLDEGEGVCEKSATLDGKTLKFGDECVVKFDPATLGVEDLETYSTIGFEVATKAGDEYTSVGKVNISISSSSSSVTGYPLDDGKGNVFCAVKKILETFESAEQRKSAIHMDVSGANAAPAPAPAPPDGGEGQ